MEINHLRHEVKQSISCSDYTILKQMLSTLPVKDVRAAACSRIHCLHFETAEDKDPCAQKSGSGKFTMQYQNEDLSGLILLKKSKRKGSVLERVTRLSIQECQRIIADDYGFLKGSEDPLLVEFYKLMALKQIRPKILVDCSREVYSFLDGNISVTLDSDFCTGFNTSDFLNDRHPTIKRSGQILMEIKYDKYLPEIFSRLLTQEKNQKPEKLALAVNRI